MRGAGPAPCPEPFRPLPGTAVPTGPQSWSELDLWPCPEVAGLWPGAGASQYTWSRNLTHLGASHLALHTCLTHLPKHSP